MKKILLIILIILVILIIIKNYRSENFISNIKDQLTSIIMNSNSNELVQDISKNMNGSTMHHHYHILYDIRTLLGPGKKIYTEIGTYNGGSASLMLSHPYATEINCIDPLHVMPNQRQLLESNIKKYNVNNYDVNIYQKFSTDTTFIQELKNKNFKTDIFFIDGDHSYDAVINDFYKFEEFVNPGGFIIFDDYEDYKDSPDVKLAVDNIVSKLNLDNYIIIGTLPNLKNAYDGLNLKISNEYIIQKITV
jgi:predicted O-methyltransferase YrrM